MSNERLVALAEGVAVYANQCCNRSDGYEDDVRERVLSALRLIATEAREGALNEAIAAMGYQCAELEMAEIAKAKEFGRGAGVLYNPEQTLWRKAASIIGALKAKL